MAIVKHTVICDWLEFMVSGQLVHFDQPKRIYEYEQGRTKLIQQKVPSRNFKYHYEIWRDGRKFAHIYCGPRTPEIIKPDLIQVKIENPVLYEVGSIIEVKEVFKVLAWEVKNVTRLDVAIDGVDVIALGDSFFKGEIAKKGKSRFTAYFTSKRELEGYDVGKRSSDKWITCYVKSKELEKSNKLYIRDFWERAGLDTEYVERFELKLRNEAIKMIQDFDWTRLDDFEYLASICRTQAEKIFCFIEKTEDSNVSRAKRIDNWCDWDAIGAGYLDKLSARETTELYRLKFTSKSMYWLYLATGEKYHADIALDIAMNINCVQWYIDKMPKWKREFEERYGDNPDGEIKFRYLSNFRSYTHGEQLHLYEK